MAHDQRRGGIRLLRRRHSAVPHQRRRRVCAREVRARHRRRGVHGERRRRPARRDRAPLVDARLLARGLVPHPRRDRSGRVHDGRERQPLHERDGAVQRACGRSCRARDGRPRPRAVSGDGGPPRVASRGSRRLGAARRCDPHPVQRRGRHPPAGRAVLGTRAVGSREHVGRTPSAAAALPPARDLPVPGAQAGGRRAGGVPAGECLHGGREARRLRVLRPAHDRRFHAVGRRAGGDGRRGRLPGARARILRALALR